MGVLVPGRSTLTTYGSVCSGIESASVAWEPLGMRPLWFSEIEPFPCAVLAHRWPEVPNMGNMKGLPAMIRAGVLPAPDILVGGTPCQAFSIAGSRRSLDDDRGQLTLTYVDILNAIDEQRQGDECVAVWENVPGVLSTRDNAFGCFLGELAGSGIELQPGERPAVGKSSTFWRWNKKSGVHVARWPNSGSVRGPRRSIAWRTLDAQYFGVAQRRRRVFVVASARDEFNPAKVLFESEGLRRDSPPSRETGTQASALTANGVGTCGADDNQAQAGHLVANPLPGGVARALTAVGTATGRLDPNGQTFAVRTANTSSNGCGVNEHTAYTLDSAQGQAVAVSLRGREGGATAELGGDLSPSLRASQGGGDKQHVLCGGVRRLLPVECERLQGFADGHTLVPYRGKPASDGPRYKAIGNSKAVPVVRWVGRRLLDER